MTGFLKIAALSVSAMLLSIGADAQTVWQKCVSALKTHSASFTYSYTTKMSGTRMTVAGSVKMQGTSFVLKGGDVESWCDGNSLWTVDTQAKEVVVENFMTDSSSWPFKEISSETVDVSGTRLEKITLQPVSSAPGLSSAVVYVNAGATPPVFRKVSVVMKDGTDAEITISDMKYARPLPASSFVFDTEKLDSSWVVTDLR